MLRRALSKGERNFSFSKRVTVLWAAHASTLLSMNGPQHTPIALFKIIHGSDAALRCMPRRSGCVRRLSPPKIIKIKPLQGCLQAMLLQLISIMLRRLLKGGFALVAGPT